jgi:aldehyde:ferredoxin oxidoreductase
MDMRLLSEAVSAATGWDFTPEEAMQVGRRAVYLLRAFNIRKGLTADLERPSARYGSTPVDGPARGKAIAPHFQKMLQDYYALMGWDRTGRPLPDTLRALGLDKVAADLWPPAPKP